MVFPPLLMKHPRAPFTKPHPGTGINWGHPLAQNLVHSYPFNEGKGEQIKNYCWPAGEYDLRFRLPNLADTPRWGTFANVPGLEIDIDQASPLEQARGNTGNTNPNVTGANILPCIDFSNGFTVHIWQRPTESLVGVVTSYNLFNIGDINASVRSVMMIHFTRAAFMATDWWIANVTVYSNGVANTNVGGPAGIWEAPFTGGRVKIDSLPYEHVISVLPTGQIRWWGSDGTEINLGNLGTVITPPDNNQYWPIVSASGQPPFEGNIWAWNVYNRAMGFYSAMELMSNPLGMYQIHPSGGSLITEIVPPILPPTGGAGGSDADDDILNISQICVDTI